MLSGQKNAPFSVSQRNLFVLIDFKANFVAVVIFVVVGSQQNQMVQFHPAQVGSHCCIVLTCVFDSKHDQVAVVMVEEILG